MKSVIFFDIYLFVDLPTLYSIGRVDISKISVCELYQKMKYPQTLFLNPMISLVVTKQFLSLYSFNCTQKSGKIGIWLRMTSPLKRGLFILFLSRSRIIY